MALYWRVGGYGHISNHVGLYALTSFGNMGFSKTICGKEIIDWTQSDSIKIQFQCDKTTEITDVLDSGILLSSSLPGGTDNVLATCDSKHLVPGSFSE